MLKFLTLCALVLFTLSTVGSSPVDTRMRARFTKDKKVIIERNNGNGTWTQVKNVEQHESLKNLKNTSSINGNLLDALVKRINDPVQSSRRANSIQFRNGRRKEDLHCNNRFWVMGYLVNQNPLFKFDIPECSYVVPCSLSNIDVFYILFPDKIDSNKHPRVRKALRKCGSATRFGEELGKILGKSGHVTNNLHKELQDKLADHLDAESIESLSNWVETAMISRTKLTGNSDSWNNQLLTPGCKRPLTNPDKLTCHLVKKMKNGCIMRVSDNDQPKNVTRTRVGYWFTDTNPCDLSSCGDDVNTVGLSECTNPLNALASYEVIEELPLNPVPNSEILTLGSSDGCTNAFLVTDKHMCSEAKCDIGVQVMVDRIRFFFTTDGPSYIEIHLEDQVHKSQQMMPMNGRIFEYEVQQWGEFKYRAICNKASYEKTLILTREEFCRSHRGWSSWFYTFRCLNPKLCYFIMIVFFVLLILTKFTFLMTDIIAYSSSFGCMCASLYLKCLCYKTCRNCGREFLFKSSLLNHTCPLQCDHCNLDLKPLRRGDNDYDMSANHMSMCSEVQGSRVNKMRRDYLGEARQCSNYLARVSRSIAWLIFFITILIIISHAETKVTDETVPHFESQFRELESLGFLPTKAAFSGSDYERTTIGLTSESKKCLQVSGSEQCEMSATVETDIRLREGFQSGYFLSTKGFTTKMDMRVTAVWAKYNLIYEYTSCATKMVTESSDTCTDDCEACVNQFSHKNKQLFKTIVKRPGSSGWRCDGFGCMSSGTGCTCGMCYHKPIMSDCLEVWRTTKLTKFFTLCFAIQNRAWCKNSTTDHVMSSKGLSIISAVGNEVINHPEMIAIRNINSPVIYHGNINKKGQFAHQFGTIQFDKHRTPMIADCIPTKAYEHICRFGEHRSFQFHSCCVDGYDMFKRDLLPMMDAQLHDNYLYVSNVDFGMTTVRMELPNIVIRKNIKKAHIQSVILISCAGCYNCVEKVIVQLSITSDMSGLADIACDRVDLKQDTIHLDKGTHTYRLVGSSSTQKGKLICKIAETHSSNAKDCELDEPPRNFHTSSARIRSDETTVKCQSWTCSWSRTWGSVFSLFGGSWLWFILCLVLSTILITIVASLLIILCPRSQSKEYRKRATMKWGASGTKPTPDIGWGFTNTGSKRD